MFADSDLVFTRDKNNEYMGGGYVLKSEFMEGGAPPIINVPDDSKPTKRKKTGNSSVSSLLFDGTRAIPAGLFLMNRHSDDAQPLSSIYDDSRMKSVLGGGDSDDSDDSDDSSSSSSSGGSGGSGGSSDDISTGKAKSGGDRHRRHHNAVVPETLYDALFKMLSPDADKRRYWGNGAKTQRRQQQQQQQQQPIKKNNTRKKNKINE